MCIRIFSLFAFLGLLALSFLPDACTPLLHCTQETSDLLINPLNRPCKRRCECNNQRYIGRCVAGRCEAVLRPSCPFKGMLRRCKMPQPATCRDGWQRCQPAHLYQRLWGDCRCDLPPKEAPSEISSERTDGGERSLEPRPPERYAEPIPEHQKTEQPPDRCPGKERCGDGIDSHCHGQSDEGCAPCAPTHLRQTLTGQGSGITTLGLSWNGKTFASASSDGTVLIRNGADGTWRWTLRKHATAISAMAFHPDHQRLYTADRNGVIYEWEVFTGKLLTTLPKQAEALLAMAISPDGTTLALSLEKSHHIELWDLKTLTRRGQLKGHNAEITSLTYTKAGKRLASASLDGTIKLWDAQRSILLQTLAGHAPKTRQIALSPDGKQLASADAQDPSSLRVWNTTTGAPLPTAQAGHNQTITALAYLNTPRLTLASASLDGTIKLWDAQSWKLLRTLKRHTSTVTALAAHPTQPLLYSGDQHGLVRRWDAAKGLLLQQQRGTAGALTGLALHPSQPLLAVSSTDGNAMLWDDHSQVAALQGHTKGLTSIAWRNDGREIATASEDGQVIRWDSQSFQRIQTLLPHPELSQRLAIQGIAYHPRGLGFATIADGPGATHLWNPQGQHLQTLNQPKYPVTRRRQVLFDPRGEQLAVLASGTQANSGWIELWTLKGMKASWKGRITGVAPSTASLSFHPSAQALAWSQTNQTVLWDLRTQKEVRRFAGASTATAWGPTGRLFAFAQREQLQVWDLQSDHLLLRSPISGVVALAFSFDGAQLYGAQRDGKIRIWSCACFQPEDQGSCYRGAPQTLAQGACQAGRWRCDQNGLRGPCVGAILPTHERPDGADNDCDGILDNGFIDLQVTKLAVSTPALQPGETFSVQVCVQNRGHLQSRSNPFSLRIFLSDDAAISRTDIALTGGQNQPHDLHFPGLKSTQTERCQHVNLTLPADTPTGSHYIGALADLREEIPESDETNNARSLPINVEKHP